MPSETSIANIAMRHLGQNPISGIDDLSENARLCKKYFDDAKATALEEYSWSWAETRVVLPADAATPAFGYAYQYLLPADCISVIALGKGGRDVAPTQRWEVNGDYIMTDIAAPIEVTMITNRSSYARMPQYLAEVIGAALAVCVAQTRQGSDTSIERMLAVYERAVQIAKRKDIRKRNQVTLHEPGTFETAMEGL